MKNLKLKIAVIFALITIHGSLFTCSAAYLQPFVYYGIDQGGSPLTNLITIQAVGTNTITAYSTFIVASVPKTYQPDVNGYVSNNIALGNYILTISNYYYSVPFSISSNAAPQNISQVAGIPVTTFMNFTLAQFSDAGTMARESTNNWTRSGTAATNTPAGIIAALGFQPAAAVVAVAGDKSAQALAAQNDAVPLQVLVSALDGDDADHQFGGQLPERRERGPFRQAALADLALEAVHDLPVKRPGRRGDRRQETGWLFLIHCTYCR